MTAKTGTAAWQNLLRLSWTAFATPWRNIIRQRLLLTRLSPHARRNASRLKRDQPKKWIEPSLSTRVDLALVVPRR